ncbi:hypothetical protein SISSUDRAFT_1031474 [Sistotremastrum suecicum HHB10207 ss-3]|uniref:Uncharacterized protein n=1 Tax=Sistotremastrum suecicum HHB10207 ss-3 TaxID=1314776 RepID=A0A166FVF4_9AGAM|nr:hypothetical protein SISSUDRAFT_1031474 [Sistotremastrum suecicum HHB10207 ss-3]
MAYNNQGYPTEGNPEQLGPQFFLNSPEARHQSIHHSNLHAAAQSSQSTDPMQIDAGSASGPSGLQHALPLRYTPTMGQPQSPPFQFVNPRDLQHNPLLDNPQDNSYDVGTTVAQDSSQAPLAGVTWNQSGAQAHGAAVPPPYTHQPHAAGVPAAPINNNPQPYDHDHAPLPTGPQPADAAPNPPDPNSLLCSVSAHYQFEPLVYSTPRSCMLYELRIGRYLYAERRTGKLCVPAYWLLHGMKERVEEEGPAIVDPILFRIITQNYDETWDISLSTVHTSFGIGREFSFRDNVPTVCGYLPDLLNNRPLEGEHHVLRSIPVVNLVPTTDTETTLTRNRHRLEPELHFSVLYSMVVKRGAPIPASSIPHGSTPNPSSVPSATGSLAPSRLSGPWSRPSSHLARQGSSSRQAGPSHAVASRRAPYPLLTSTQSDPGTSGPAIAASSTRYSPQQQTAPTRAPPSITLPQNLPPIPTLLWEREPSLVAQYRSQIPPLPPLPPSVRSQQSSAPSAEHPRTWDGAPPPFVGAALIPNFNKPFSIEKAGLVGPMEYHHVTPEMIEKARYTLEKDAMGSLLVQCVSIKHLVRLYKYLNMDPHADVRVGQAVAGYTKHGGNLTPRKVYRFTKYNHKVFTKLLEVYDWSELVSLLDADTDEIVRKSSELKAEAFGCKYIALRWMLSPDGPIGRGESCLPVQPKTLPKRIWQEVLRMTVDDLLPTSSFRQWVTKHFM